MGNCNKKFNHHLSQNKSTAGHRSPPSLFTQPVMFCPHPKALVGPPKGGLKTW